MSPAHAGTSAFHDRFTPELAELMRQLTGAAFATLANSDSRLALALSALAKVFIVDGSPIQPHDALEAGYRRCGPTTPRPRPSSMS